MSKLIIAAAILLALLHQDFWWWNDVEPIILGMPIGLAYHVLFSLLAMTEQFEALCGRAVAVGHPVRMASQTRRVG